MAAGLCWLLATSACGAAGNAPLFGAAASRGIVKVSAVDVFSGEFGSAGQYIRNSLQVETDKLNASGGLLGYRVEVVAADDEGDPDKGAELVREQVNDPEVKLVVGPNDTDVFVGAGPILTRAQVPSCLSTGVTDADVSSAPDTFRTQGRDQDRVAALTSYLLKNQPTVKKLGLLSDDDPAGHGMDSVLVNLFNGPLKTVGIGYAGAALTPITPTSDTPSGPDVVIPFVRRLLDAGAQGIILSEEPNLATLTAIAVDQMGLTGKVALLGIGGADAYQYPFTGGPAAVGTIFASTNQSYLTGVPPSRWPPSYRDFVTKITSQYGYAPNGVEMQGSPAAADCVLQWAKAVRTAGTFDTTQVVRAWEGITLPPSESALGVQETGRTHETVPASGIFVYRWARQGNRFQVNQLA
jgi:ABC-type branched-subunit amino acid transport system substrate-binding protein